MVKLMTVLFTLSTFLLPVPDWEPAAEDVEAKIDWEEKGE